MRTLLGIGILGFLVFQLMFNNSDEIVIRIQKDHVIVAVLAIGAYSLFGNKRY